MQRLNWVSLGAWAGACVLLAIGCGGSGGDSSGGGSGGSATGGNAIGGNATGGNATGGATGSTSTSNTLTSCADAERTGKVTYYGATGAGACSFDPSPGNLMVGAMNAPDYLGSAACGACASISTADGKNIVVRIVDLCPECQTGHIDLSEEAFAKLGDPSLGIIPTTWHYVSCSYQQPIQYKFKEGSNQWWTAVQIRNHANRIAKFEYEKDGAWVAVNRTDYNYFVEASGMGPGPYHFRVTDIFGQSLEDSNIPFQEGGVVNGTGQFPPCAE